MDGWSLVLTISDLLHSQKWPENWGKWAQLGQLDQLQPQISILKQIYLNQHRFPILNGCLKLSLDHLGQCRGRKWLEMAQTWLSGPRPAPDIDFSINFVKAILIPNMKLMLVVMIYPGPFSGRKWPEMAQTGPCGQCPAPQNEFQANFSKVQCAI